MNINKKTFLSQAFVQLTMFSTIPIVVAFLSEIDRTIWLIFFTISTLNPIFLLGFESSILRISSYLAGGVGTIQAEGFSEISDDAKVDVKLYLKFVHSVRKVFIWLSLIILILLLIFGTFYFHNLNSGKFTEQRIIVAWTFFALALYINNVQIYRDSVLRGFNNQLQVNLAYIASRVTFVFLSIYSTNVFSDGLLCVVVSYLISIVQLRLMITKHWKNLNTFLKVNTQEQDGEFAYSFNLLWKNSIKTALVFVGSFLTLRFGILVAPHVATIKDSANYILFTTLILGIAGVSTELAKIFLPYLHISQLEKIQVKIVEVFSQMYSIAITSFFLGVGALFVFWKAVFACFASIGDLPTTLVLSISCVTLLELTNSIYTMLISSNNSVPHWKSSLYSGFGNLFFLAILSQKFSIVGIILSQLISGVFWNYWGWIRKASILYGVNPYSASILGFRIFLRR